MTTDFAIVLHFHQPVGNFDDVLERVAERCYRPLLQLLAEHPGVKSHLHLNGILLAWMDRAAPDLIAIIATMARRGQVELLGGGHQEPILSVLPERDAIGQIRALSDELHRRFGRRPRGLWLTERVWEPRLPTPLAAAGMQYTVLDDTMLRWSGVEDGQLWGYWMTEDQGHPLAIYPGRTQLRYSIPFRPHAETLEYLRAQRVADAAARPHVAPLAVYADDAEKFGEWPRTHHWVYTQRWLPQLLELLEQEQRDGGVRTVHLSDHLRAHPPVGRVYPPTASYHELTEWALPTPARLRLEALTQALDREDPLQARPFVRGSYWRGFLAKYPEADRLHKRMLRVSAQLADVAERFAGDPRVEAARRDLYAGQCNDAYWHGSFGGLYLVHLRRAVERHLIRAERTLDALTHAGDGSYALEGVDLNADGSDELLLRTAHAMVAIDPGRGGAILAWDLRGACENLVTVLARHDEAFHQALRGLSSDQLNTLIAATERADRGEEPAAGTEGIESIHGGLRVKAGVRLADLRVDTQQRLAWMEWRAAPAAGSGSDASSGSEAGSRSEAGSGSAAAPAPAEPLLESATALDGVWEVVHPGTDADVALAHADAAATVRKSLRVGRSDASLTVRYDIAPQPGAAPFQWLSQWNLLIGHTGDDLEVEDEAARIPAPHGVRRAVGRLRFHGGGGRSLELRCTPSATIAWEAVHTISSSEAGLEKTGQGTAFLVSWPVNGPLQAKLELSPSAPALPDAPVLPNLE